nr:hypothetical protein [Tanacetum cinerariifolium]
LQGAPAHRARGEEAPAPVGGKARRAIVAEATFYQVLASKCVVHAPKYRVQGPLLLVAVGAVGVVAAAGVRDAGVGSAVVDDPEVVAWHVDDVNA